MHFGRKTNREALSREFRELVRKRSEDLGQGEDRFSCRIDTDCPPGFVCVGGQCVPYTA
jgi:hypothetical protein